MAASALTMASNPRRLLRLPALRRKLGDISVETIYRWMRNRGFPRPIKLTKNVGLWDEEEVDAWVERRAKGR